MHRFSYSQLSTFETCELAWKLGKLDKVDQRTAGWFHQGTAAHFAIEEWLREDTAIDIEGAFSVAYDVLINDYSLSHPHDHLWMRGRGTPTADVKKRGITGLEQVRQFKAWWKGAGFTVAMKQDEPMLESKVYLETGNWSVVGYVDAVLIDSVGDRWIVDFKTGKSRAHNDGRQLALYKTILDKEGINHKVAYIYLNEDKAPDFVPMDVERYDMQHFVDSFNAMADAIDEKKITGNWVASPPKPCFTCTVAHHCTEKELDDQRIGRDSGSIVDVQRPNHPK